MPREGVEPSPRYAGLAPEASASANSATAAWMRKIYLIDQSCLGIYISSRFAWY